MARKFSYLAIVFACCLLVKSSLYPSLPKAGRPLILYSNQIQVDLKRVMITAIQSAKRSIFLQIYGLTDPDLISLLQKKKEEGLEVKIFFDPSGSGQSLPSFAQPVNCKGLMHKKILVIDEEKSFVGTANLTPSSLHFHSNLVLGIYSPLLARYLSHSVGSKGLFSLQETNIETYHLPDPQGIALSRLCQCLDGAEKEIHLAIFTLTHPRIVDALIRAVKRGVEVKVASDFYAGKGASYGALERLREGGASVTLSRGPELLHHKWALIDQNLFIVGSANWTRAAFEKNQDILCILTHLPPSDCKKVNRLWKTLLKESRP